MAKSNSCAARLCRTSDVYAALRHSCIDLFIVGVPLAIGVIPRNPLYGFRTRRTLADDAVWYPVNRMAGWGIMIATAIYAMVAVARPYGRDFSVWLLHLAAFAIPLVTALIVSGWYLSRQ